MSEEEDLLWSAEPDLLYNLCSFVYVFPYSFGIFMAAANMEYFLRTVGQSCECFTQERYSLPSVIRKWGKKRKRANLSTL